MSHASPAGSPAPTRTDGPPNTSATSKLYWAAAIVTFATVAMGSLVCATDSSHACPNWPGCYVGQVVPEATIYPWIEFVHRVVAVSTGPLLLIAALLGLRQSSGRTVWTRVLPWVALAGALAAGVFGMMVIRFGISKAQSAADLGSALVAMVAITLAASALSQAPRSGNPPARWAPTRTTALAAGSVALFIIVHVTGIIVSGPGSLTRCVSCPVWTIVEIDGPVALQVTRMLLAAIAIGLAVAAMGSAFRDHRTGDRSRPDLRPYAVAAAILLVIELVGGIMILTLGVNDALAGAYAVTMGALLWSITLVMARSAFAATTSAERADASSDTARESVHAG